MNTNMNTDTDTDTDTRTNANTPITTPVLSPITADETPLDTPRLRTPYHELGVAGEPRVPGWARNRAVYRTSGRTLYLVETDRLDEARPDLDALAERGWTVQIDRVDRGADGASIALTRLAA